MNSIEKRLRASLSLDAINGDAFERSVCASQMKEAAETIAHLRQSNKQAVRELVEFLGALKESGGVSWYPVDVMLPEDGALVLVYMAETKFSQLAITDAEYNGGGRFFTWNPMECEHVDLAPAVTHWMPMPPPPEV